MQFVNNNGDKVYLYFENETVFKKFMIRLWERYGNQERLENKYCIIDKRHNEKEILITDTFLNNNETPKINKGVLDKIAGCNRYELIDLS